MILLSSNMGKKLLHGMESGELVKKSMGSETLISEKRVDDT